MSGSDFSGEDSALKIDESKGKDVGREKEAKWKPQPGNIVWAKVAGYNHWPGKVFSADDDLIPEWLQQEDSGSDRVLVRFFGTYDIEWVALKAVESYDDGLKKKLHSKSRRKAFVKAVKEVKECVDKGTEPEGMTAKPANPDQEEEKSASEKEEEAMEEGGVGGGEEDAAPRARRSKRLRRSRSTPGRTPKKQKLSDENEDKTPKKASSPMEESSETPKKSSEMPKKSSESPKKTIESPKKTNVLPKKSSVSPKKSTVSPKKTSEPAKKTSEPAKKTSEPPKKSVTAATSPSKTCKAAPAQTDAPVGSHGSSTSNDNAEEQNTDKQKQEKASEKGGEGPAVGDKAGEAKERPSVEGGDSSNTKEQEA